MKRNSIVYQVNIQNTIFLSRFSHYMRLLPNQIEKEATNYRNNFKFVLGCCINTVLIQHESEFRVAIFIFNISFSIIII